VAVNEVSRVYASSLVEIGQEKNVLDQLEEEIKIISDIISEDNDLKNFLASPGITKKSKKDFFGKVFSGNVSEFTVNFLNLLLENDRQTAIPEIYEAMTELIDEVNNRLRVSLITRYEVDEASKNAIIEKLAKRFNKEIILREEIREDILGGIIIKIGDLVIDGSLLKDLKNIRNNLLNSKVRSEMAYED